MKAARFRPSDSLDLLLDTMCNTFGGIILIAILVALLARQSPAPLQPAAQAYSAMIERRLATAEAELAAARALRAGLEAQASPELANQAAEKQRLADALNAAQAAAESSAAQAAKTAAMKSADPGKLLADLAAQASAQERRATELENALAAQAQNSERLRARLTGLAAQAEREIDTRTTQLRLPKERAKTKANFNVILRFGRGYPLTDADGRRNRETINWQDTGGSHRARPIAGSGADAEALARFFRTLPREEVYVAFYVYPDAFDLFSAAREAAIQAGLDYGLDIIPAGIDLKFGSEGTSPRPL